MFRRHSIKSWFRCPRRVDIYLLVITVYYICSTMLLLYKTDVFSLSNTDDVQKIRHYFLSEILMVRIYDTDKAKWTVKELKQWLHYIFFAGVEHVYLCDNFIHEDERLDRHLSKYIQKGLITYIPWPWTSRIYKKDLVKHQANCYRHVNQTHGNESTWQISIDMDEYPLCPHDVTKGFLARFVEKESCDRCQMLMKNYLMLGQGDRNRTMVIERINRIVKSPLNALTKPIYKPANTRGFLIHYNMLWPGYSTKTLDADKIRMLHYWGARMQDWGPDTRKTIEGTEEFNVIRDTIAKDVRLALQNFGEYDAFSSTTGP